MIILYLDTEFYNGFSNVLHVKYVLFSSSSITTAGTVTIIKHFSRWVKAVSFHEFDMFLSSFLAIFVFLRDLDGGEAVLTRRTQ